LLKTIWAIKSIKELFPCNHTRLPVNGNHKKINKENIQ
jgi:hypothetical protein